MWSYIKGCAQSYMINYVTQDSVGIASSRARSLHLDFLFIYLPRLKKNCLCVKVLCAFNYVQLECCVFRHVASHRNHFFSFMNSWQRLSTNQRFPLFSNHLFHFLKGECVAISPACAPPMRSALTNSARSALRQAFAFCSPNNRLGSYCVILVCFPSVQDFQEWDQD